MKRLTLLLLFFLFGCQTYTFPQNGVYKLRDDSNSACTAFLISEDTAITARHCIIKHMKRIHLIDNQGERVSVRAVGILDGSDFAHDMAMLKLSRPIPDALIFEVSPDIKKNFKIAGYDKGVDPVQYNGEIILDTLGLVHIRSTKISGGMSGSPLFYVKQDGTHVAFALLVWRNEEDSTIGGAAKLNGRKFDLAKKYLKK